MFEDQIEHENNKIISRQGAKINTKAAIFFCGTLRLCVKQKKINRE